MLEGWWKFCLFAPQLERTFVRPEVQDRYTAQLLTAQPLLRRVLRRVRRALSSGTRNRA